MPGDEGPRGMDGDEAQAIHNLFHWASGLALPSSEFAVAFDETAETTQGKLGHDDSKVSTEVPQKLRKPKKSLA